MRFIPLLAAALIICPLRAQNSVVISGRVTDASTGLPIEDASVSLASTPGQLRFTDAGGSYAFEPVEPGNGAVRVEAKGFLPFQRTNPDDAAIQIAANHGDYNFRLTPAASITGKISGEDSFSGLSAWLLQEDFSDGVRRFAPAGNKPGTASPIAADGSFRFTALGAGRYIIGVGPQADVFFIERDATGKPAMAKRPEEGYAPTYFPGTTDFSAAIPISLTAGEMRTVDFKVRKQHLFKASGDLAMPSMNLPWGVVRIVRLNEGVEEAPHSATVSASGHFVAEGLPPGRYQAKNVMLSTGESRLDGSVSAFQIATVGAFLMFSITDHDVDGLKVVPAPAMPSSINGSFQMAKGGALPSGLGVQFAFPEPGGRSDLIPAAEGGQFWLTGPAGDYSVRPLVPANYAVTEIRYGGGNYLNSRIPMRGAVADPTLIIVLSDQPGSASGFLVDKDQKPVAANIALVPELIPSDFDFRAIRVAKTDEKGVFVFRGLAPGRYKAVALTGDDRRQDHDMALIGPRLALADAFEVTAGQTTGLNLR